MILIASLITDTHLYCGKLIVLPSYTATVSFCVAHPIEETTLLSSGHGEFRNPNLLRVEQALFL